MNNDFILKAESISKSYRMGASEVKVLKGVDLAVKKGEFVAIVGASGSGNRQNKYIPDIATIAAITGSGKGLLF